jgi:hypothetical protein
MVVPAAPVPAAAEPVVAARRSLRRAAIVLAFIASAVAGILAGSTDVFRRADDRPSFPPDPSRAAASAAATTGMTEPTTPAGTTESGAEGALSPSRTFAWTPVAGADRYRIRFYRNGDVMLEGHAETPRFVLPRRFEFRPGAYRWTVEPRRDGAYGPPVVDSRFEVAG